MKDFIKSKLTETIYRITEDGKDDEEGEISGKYGTVQDLLDNEIFNHSEVIRQLWGEDNATKRSLFRKKLHRETNDEGSTYEFEDEELTKISNILMTTSSDIRKKIGRNVPD